MKNHSIELYLRLLAHPFSLFACAVLLINDFVLKLLFPSVITGKLSDFAGLFLLPLLVGALLCVVTHPLHVSDRVTFGAAIFFTGAIYTAAKVIPPFTNYLNQALAIRIVPDTSDLIAIPVLAGSALLWRSLRAKPAPTIRWQWAALPLILIATMADMAAPDYGISCMRSEGSNLYSASSIGKRYVSTDGGITWLTDTSEQFPVCQPGDDSILPGLEDTNHKVQYRFSSGSLEISSDGGTTWVNESIESSISQAEQTFIQLNSTGNPVYRSGILDAAIDPNSGNLVLAMGHEGVLVRELTGTYIWADVGPYMHLSLRRSGFNGFFTLLYSSLLVALLGALLAMRTWALQHDATPAQVALTVLSWIIVLIVAGLSLPGLIPYQSLARMVSSIAFAVGLVFLLAMNLLAHSRMHEVTAWWTRLVPSALLIALVSWLFYVLWYFNLIPYYWLAAVLSTAWFIGALIWQMNRLPKAEINR